MTNQSTLDKLIEMRLTAMADAFRNQLDDPKLKEMPFEDQFGMLVDIEYSSRKNNRLKRLIKNAGFDQPEANIMDINYTSGRKLNKELIHRLATCEYISEHRNLFITGATGCGKTYMACAFGMEACKQYFNTKYVRLPDLLIDLEMARTDGNYKKVMAKYANPVVLILDEWLLLKPTDSEQRDIFELLHRRRKKSSTIFCSQYEFEEWYDQLGGDDSPLADAIIDRIAHDSYRINITSIEDLKECTKGFYQPDNDGASACKAQAMFIHKYGKEKFFYVHDKLHEVHDFKKTQEILGTDAEEGLKILERYL